MLKVVKSAVSELSNVRTVDVLDVVVEIRKVRPAALPLVIRIILGVAAMESSPATHPAAVSVMVLEVTEAIWPLFAPETAVVLTSGKDKTVRTRPPLPYDGVMFVLIYPTGSVVPSCAAASRESRKIKKKGSFFMVRLVRYHHGMRKRKRKIVFLN